MMLLLLFFSVPEMNFPVVSRDQWLLWKDAIIESLDAAVDRGLARPTVVASCIAIRRESRTRRGFKGEELLGCEQPVSKKDYRTEVTLEVVAAVDEEKLFKVEKIIDRKIDKNGVVLVSIFSLCLELCCVDVL